MKRFLNRIYAHLFGYFWLPCPNCGRYFGGHEIGKLGFPTGLGTWRVCCKWCDDDKDLDKRFQNFKKSIMESIIVMDTRRFIDKEIREDSLLMMLRARSDFRKSKESKS
jgi:hypothetical protein